MESEAKTALGQPAEALAVIARAVSAAGDVSGWLAAQMAEARARALAALGRREAAEASVEEGLAVARAMGLRYEEGLLLQRRAALLRVAGCELDTSEAGRCTEIVAALGIVTMPSAQ